jgi:hypothetical protein
MEKEVRDEKKINLIAHLLKAVHCGYKIKFYHATSTQQRTICCSSEL